MFVNIALTALLSTAQAQTAGGGTAGSTVTYDEYVRALSQAANGNTLSQTLPQTGMGEVGVFNLTGDFIAFMGTNKLDSHHFEEHVFFSSGFGFSAGEGFVLTHTGLLDWASADIPPGWENRHYLDLDCSYVEYPGSPLTNTLNFTDDITRWSFVLYQGPDLMTATVKGYMHREMHTGNLLNEEQYYDHYVFGDDYEKVQHGGDTVWVVLAPNQHSSTAVWFGTVDNKIANNLFNAHNYTQIHYQLKQGQSYQGTN